MGPCLSRSPPTKFAEKFLGRREERILLQSAADDHHRMGPHDVDYGVPAELGKVVGADHRIVMLVPNLIHARFKFDDVLQAGLVSSYPIHPTHNATERISARRVT